MNDLTMYFLIALVIFLAIGIAFHRYQFQRQKQTEVMLRASEARFRDLAYSVADWLYETDDQLRITYCSEHIVSILGFTAKEGLGRTPLDFAPVERQARVQSFITEMCAKPKSFKGIEVWAQHKNGRRAYLSVSGTPFYGGHGEFLGYRGAIQDISERVQSAKALQYSEALNRSVLESLPHNIFAKDLEGRFTFANQRYCQTQGKSLQEIIGQTDDDLHPPELAQKYRQDDLAVIESGEITDIVEEHQPLGQERFYVQVIKAPIHNAAGNISGVLGIFWDITEKQRMETAIRKLNRALHTISECNQVLVRATDEQSLYDQICRLVVEIGGHIFAWIGGINEKEPLTIQPTAHFGAGDFSLQPVSITGNGIPAGGEPSQAAISQHSTIIVQDIRAIPPSACWRAEALRCGFASIVALPICFDEEVFGCLSIYAQESYAFDPAEISLLEELADDLAFGISALRTRSERQQALEALRQSEQRYRTLFERANDAIFLNSIEDKIVDANRRACEMLGYTREELVKLQISDIIAPEIGRSSHVVHEEIAAYGNKPFESIDIRKDGERVPVEVTNTVLSENLTLSIVRDIRERKQAEERLQQINQELSQAYDATLRGWSRALELRERETAGHSHRVVEMTLKMAHTLGINGDRLIHVQRGVLLHDIGKMGIPDNILLKPGPLSPEEWEIMHRHPTFAYDLLADIPYLRPALDIPYCHHERWDGSGYPRGLKGEQIPLAARIFAIVDVWDALTSERPYHAAWDVEQARQYVMQQAGKHFDPQVVETFLKLNHW